MLFFGLFDGHYPITKSPIFDVIFHRYLPEDHTNNYRLALPEKKQLLHRSTLRPCLVHPKNQKVYKISRHIESCGICMKLYI